ncbi:MAG: hypothetical protein H6811_05790 [Phycisphaeraceae bacterium]|nr:hypothetical protein [Phycisphaeraceae bacterium]
MHDPSAEGNDYFRCDFCGSGWSEQRPMVEGHRGSLICAPCLRLAYASVMLRGEGIGPRAGIGCVLCLRTVDGPHWVGPHDESVVACRECIERSARVLEKDAESGWTRPE